MNLKTDSNPKRSTPGEIKKTRGTNSRTYWKLKRPFPWSSAKDGGSCWNNAPLTYFYPNTIKTCLTPNHLLFGRQLDPSRQTVLSSTTNKINRISNDFLDRWSYVYIRNLRQTQRTSKLNVNPLKINVNDIVLVFYEKVLRHLWRFA